MIQRNESYLTYTFLSIFKSNFLLNENIYWLALMFTVKQHVIKYNYYHMRVGIARILVLNPHVHIILNFDAIPDTAS